MITASAVCTLGLAAVLLPMSELWPGPLWRVLVVAMALLVLELVVLLATRPWLRYGRRRGR